MIIFRNREAIRKVIYATAGIVNAKDIIAARALIRHGINVHIASEHPVAPVIESQAGDVEWEPFTLTSIQHTTIHELVKDINTYARVPTTRLVTTPDDVVLCLKDGSGQPAAAVPADGCSPLVAVGAAAASRSPPLPTYEVPADHGFEAVAVSLLGASWLLDPGYYRFGPHKIPLSQIFHMTEKSIAFTNIRPVIQGHVLIVPRRLSRRYGALDLEELVDLHTSVQFVGSRLEEHYKAHGLTITIQDGAAAGQTVPHLHIHVLPRWTDDIAFAEKDQVYKEIDRSERHQNTCETGASPSGRAIAVDPFPHTGEPSNKIIPGVLPGPRTLADMADEAREYRHACAVIYHPEHWPACAGIVS